MGLPGGYKECAYPPIGTFPYPFSSPQPRLRHAPVQAMKPGSRGKT